MQPEIEEWEFPMVSEYSDLDEYTITEDVLSPSLLPRLSTCAVSYHTYVDLPLVKFVVSRPLESVYFDVLDCPGLPVEEVVEHLGGCCKTLRHLTFCYRIPEDQHSSFAKDIIETISQWLPQLKTLYFWQEAISVKVWITFLSLTLFYLILYSNRNFPKPRMHCRDSPN